MNQGGSGVSQGGSGVSQGGSGVSQRWIRCESGGDQV